MNDAPPEVNELESWQAGLKLRLNEPPKTWPVMYLKLKIPQGELWVPNTEWEQATGDLRPVYSPLPVPWLGGIVSWRGIVHTVLRWSDFLGIPSEARHERSALWLLRLKPQPIAWPFPFPSNVVFEKEALRADEQGQLPNPFCLPILGRPNAWLLDNEKLLQAMFNADPQVVLRSPHVNATL